MTRRLFLALACFLALVVPAHATWSIVVVNRRTGEVGVGSATCIARINLLSGLPTVVPGVGAGVIQASGSSSDLLAMTQGLRMGLAPDQILVLVQNAEPSVRQLQTGIVSFYPGAPVTFTGRNCGAAKFGVTGEVGDLAYAIQGNVLAGNEVVLAAEAALLDAPGDTGQKLLAAMQAARLLGGDGRCSCSFSDPDRCGAPPANFQKSAHVGFIVITRIGDDVPPCAAANGNDCASGRFHLRLNIRGADADENDPDPVDQLGDRYAEWRAERAGRPDGLLSTVDAVDSLPADGLTKREVTVQLVDLEGVPLDHGGAHVTVQSADGARPSALVGTVVDLGDGRYRFSLAATTRTGTDRFAIVAEDDLVRATLYPLLEVRSEPPTALHAGADRLSASRGGTVPFVVSRPDLPGAPYLLLCSASGTSPGVPLGGGRRLPLVPDTWFDLAGRNAGRPGVLPGSRGVLDDRGRAEAELRAPAGALNAIIGRRLDWSVVLSDGAGLVATAPVGVEIVP